MEQFVELTSIAFLMYRKLTQNQKPDVHSETSYSGVSIHIQKSKKKIQSIIVNMYILHLSLKRMYSFLMSFSIKHQCLNLSTKTITTAISVHFTVLFTFVCMR